MNTNKLTLSALAVAAVLHPYVNANDDINNLPTEYVERIQIIGHDDKLRTEAGAATLIGEVELEKFKFDDINRVLYSVPGVNIREEDGYGLRPNIGFRGATPERSKKITVMEDGVLIGPAPYSAPAAYYFPMMSKMTAVEVFKGPAAIKYGPNTVAGALNMTTRQIPSSQEGALDVAAGSDGYAKAKAYFGSTSGNFGYLVEAVHIQADGFKELDSGGDTGFDKNDIMAKFQYDLSDNNYNQLVELKLSHADEISDETYLGLTDADFKQNANRRYVASQNDLMDWDHQQVQFTHFIGNDNFDVTTRLYRNDFERSWYKINGFKDGAIVSDLQAILANPETDVNLPFYQVLTGQRDTEREYEKIILGDNQREYYSQGIQSELYLYQELFDVKHSFNVGFRYHQDQIQRRHTTDAYSMVSSQLVSDGSATIASADGTNTEQTTAVAVFFKDTMTLGDLDLTLGLRGEFIEGEYQNDTPGKEGDWQKKNTDVWLPSISGFYTLSEHSGLFFGIHEGFVPTSPKELTSVKVESSINYELGARYHNKGSQLEAVLFYNDIDNLKEGCSFSTASQCANNIDAEFNSSEASVVGLELSAQHTYTLSDGFDLPISLSYTYTSGEFDNAFTSDFSMWGAVEAGDALPYLPENQLTLDIGLAANAWQVNLITRYISEMKEASGEGVLLSGVTTEALTVVDIAASYELGEMGNVYFKVDNVFDDQEIISHRPYGARPSKPRTAVIGYQYSF
ncbi:TonB-dependent receptor [Colwellia sp. 1_MG-2023]|uniref:TonB-dependent receptor family protein n=1 Tax=Colwellia sp. 1_MG-2023 TaxID=3062649 RepID=UPI0026E26306|nr:TonB-dependent receptor [Colwellia sp. 1_MG-2023]MDO6445886.1 TonB-dependent receptor [Colwellia sp. 1_MG-2023]